jgi:threonine/homoserine/homoserine lactone efflux protein
MGTVLGDILPLALGVAISPMPIIAVILMLLSARATAASLGFMLGWVAGIVVAATILTVIATTAGLSNSGNGSTAGSIIKLILGALLLLLALKQWRGRPRGDVAPEPPKWLAAIDSVTPTKATGLGFALAAINPKNLLMILGAAVAIGQANLSVGQIVAEIAIFTVIAASTVAVPLIAYHLAPVRARTILDEMKTWLVANNSTVMMTLFAVIGVVLIGKGIGGF